MLQRDKPSAWIWRYGASVFVASAILMILEISAGRLIAPYVGTSLYSWTAVIGVVLAGLSVGNWAGGYWADRGGRRGAVGLTLLVAAALSLAVPLVLTVAAPLVQASGLSLLGASFALVIALFFLPAASLGVVTPLLTNLALEADVRRGRVVGTMHALAAFGSIVGTFAAGYWLVQYLGTRMLLVAVSAALALLAIPFVRARAATLAAASAVVIALGATTHVRDGFANPCDEESQYYCLRVDDLSHEAPFGVARGLVLDHLLHGVNHESEPGMLLAPYLHLSDELMLGYLGPRATNPKVFFAGGGGYTHPRAVAALAPESEVTVAEIDPTVTRFAREHLFVDTERMRVLHTDARVALTKLEDERFDAIVGDVFQDIAMPYHLATREFAALVRERLTDRGVFLINVLDAHPDPLLVKAMMKTLSLEFRHVHVWLEEIPPAPVRTTYVISASNLAEPPPVLVAQRGFDRRWLRVTDRVSSTGTPLAEIPVLRDDFVPVERLVSRLLITPLGR